MAAAASPRMVCLGIVTAAHGVRGEVRIRSFTHRPQDFAAYGDLYDEAGERCFRARARGVVRGSVVAAIEGVESRDAAEGLRGLRLCVPRAALPGTDGDEYYHTDLIGLRAELVADDTGVDRPLGVVSAVEDFGAGPVLEIAVEGKPPVMVPFTREVVPVVDLAEGRIGIAAVPGLLAEPPGRHPHPPASQAPPSPTTQARVKRRRSCRSSPSPYGRGPE